MIGCRATPAPDKRERRITMKKIGERTWTVEFDWFAGKPMAMMQGFNTYEEAVEWIDEHEITDGEIICEERIW